MSVKDTAKDGNLNIRLPSDFKRRAKEVARSEHRSLAELILMLLEEHVMEYERKAKRKRLPVGWPESEPAHE